MQPNCIVEVDSIVLPHPVHINEFYNSIPPHLDESSHLEEMKIDSTPCQISTPIAITSKPCQQPSKFHEQPTAFQIKIRMKMFNPLKLPYLLHPYPINCYEYLP
jgi:hypothetical protein